MSILERIVQVIFFLLSKLLDILLYGCKNGVQFGNSDVEGRHVLHTTLPVVGFLVFVSVEAGNLILKSASNLSDAEQQHTDSVTQVRFLPWTQW